MFADADVVVVSEEVDRDLSHFGGPCLFSFSPLEYKCESFNDPTRFDLRLFPVNAIRGSPSPRGRDRCDVVQRLLPLEDSFLAADSSSRCIFCSSSVVNNTFE